MNIPDELDRLERLLAKATPGPWEYDGCSLSDFGREWPCSMSMEWIPNGRADEEDSTNCRAKEDGALIAAAINALPSLISAARQAHVMKEALKPFAKMGALLDGPFAPALFQDDQPSGIGGAWSENGEMRTITFGDLRRARKALTDQEA